MLCFLSNFLFQGKGYPDMNTRFLLKQIWLKYRLPMYILTDADPHGIEIMLTYRHGSLVSILSGYMYIYICIFKSEFHQGLEVLQGALYIINPTFNRFSTFSRRWRIATMIWLCHRCNGSAFIHRT